MKNYKFIPGNEKYIVSECGTSVINTDNKKEIKIQDNVVNGKVSGYKYITLVKGVWEGKCYQSRRFPLHRIVLIAHKGYEAGKPWVNHKDGNKSNNHIDNLEWTTISENIQHAHDTGLRKTPTGQDNWNYGLKRSDETKRRQSQQKQGKKHPKYKGFYICHGKKYYSAIEAAKALNLHAKSIIRWCKSTKHVDFTFVPDTKDSPL